jgi:hypothetical protein
MGGGQCNRTWRNTIDRLNGTASRDLQFTAQDAR